MDAGVAAIIDKLKNTENFEIWNFQINIVFKANNLIDIINGKSIFEDLERENEKTNWVVKDAKAQKYIISSVEKTVLTHILNCKSSKEMYEKLCVIFQKVDEQLECKILQDFYSFKFNKDCDVVTNISKIQNLAFKLNNLKQAISEKMVISKIMTILPDEYRFFSTAWDSTPKEEKILTNLISRLTLEETKFVNKIKNEESVAMNATRLQQVRCYSCNKIGHTAKFCDKRKRCSICNRTNHQERECFYKKSDQYHSREKQIFCKICKKTNHQERDCFFKNKEKGKISFFAEENMCTKENSSVEFVVDSGSTCHMVNNVQLLKYKESCDSKITVAKKQEVMTAVAVGRLEGKTCDLKEVMYVPNLTKNLLSVSAITKNKGKIIFQNDTVIIMKDEIKVLEGKKQENGLYIVNIKTESTEVNETTMLSIENTETMKWHRKLGHIGMTSLDKLRSMVKGLNIGKIHCDETEVCDICLKAKQVRKPFNSIRSRAKRPLEIIHSDLCGPIDPFTYDNRRYILTFLDDYTHFSYVYLLRNKYEVKDYIKEYVNEVENLMNRKVSKLRCDNGGEFLNEDVKNWCKTKGIILDNTIPYSPQMNGKAERLNRTLIEKTRALLLDSGLNKEMWGEAVRVAAYLLNRSPTSVSEKTPSEMWYKTKPNLSNLKLFGCSAFAKTLGQLKKLDDRSKKFIFVGYAKNGYRLWDQKKIKKL